MSKIYNLKNEIKLTLIGRFLVSLLLAFNYPLWGDIHPFLGLSVATLTFITMCVAFFRLQIDRFLIRQTHILFYRSIFERKIHYKDIVLITDNFNENIKLSKKNVIIKVKNNKSYKIRLYKYENYSEILDFFQNLAVSPNE